MRTANPTKTQAPHAQTTANQQGQAKPQLPHERDESADTAAEPDPVTRQAHQDVVSGKVDTDKGPVLEALNRRLPPSAPGPKGKRDPEHPPR
ncbi:hypothetical protein LRH25_03180 [Ideonella azotifigens]|uniref:Uncharacterized protein n=1 Tax=Ideonella azotifigens TaxID=513160 RepID=A0ABN1KJU5_9BURK|nr:hypothetical protein [Ideonella azotifigens]MCD2339337.1 hypothetical protein [Ideonella azotifigens]